MGLVSAKITLSNPRKPELAPVEFEALADIGAIHLCIPEHVRLLLDLEEIGQKEATLADEHTQGRRESHEPERGHVRGEVKPVFAAAVGCL